MMKIGFIGLGEISNENVLGYLDSKEAEIVAVCRRNRQAAEMWLEKWGIKNARYYYDYEDMVDSEKLDIVEILTPHHLHCEQAVYCAKAKIKGISLQKPMANSLAECKEIIDVCKENNVILKVYDNFIFYPVYTKAKQLIKDGLIGDLISIRINTMAGLKDGADWPWCFKPDSWRADIDTCGVGPLVGDDGYHKFSLARWFMERDIEKISAWIDPETYLDAPAFIRAKFRRNAGDIPKYAQIDFSFSPKMALPFEFWLDDFIEIVGEKGIMWINQCSAAGNRKMFAGNLMSKSPVFPPIAVYLDGKVTTYMEEINDQERNWSTSFIAGTRHFIDVMARGGDPMYTGEEGMEITRYAMAAYLSAQEGRDVFLDELTVEAEKGKLFKIKDNFCRF
ncbi:MAG: Gfo/Idh/MocA family oxidoreductase [Ruminiclostridium sp.]|nr:Gfo/Idh/MocA family oxidoreductase [Ruminiclostridium sp.]